VELQLHRVKTSEKDFESFCKILPSRCELQCLGLRKCQVGSFRPLQEALPRLASLVSLRIEDINLSSLSAVAASSIRHLDLSNSELDGDALHKIAAALPTLANLVSLNLSDNQFSSDSATNEAVSLFFAHVTKSPLRELCLRNTDLAPLILEKNYLQAAIPGSSLSLLDLGDSTYPIDLDVDSLTCSSEEHHLVRFPNFDR
jgi:hypothetical protein